MAASNSTHPMDALPSDWRDFFDAHDPQLLSIQELREIRLKIASPIANAWLLGIEEVKLIQEIAWQSSTMPLALDFGSQ